MGGRRLYCTFFIVGLISLLAIFILPNFGDENVKLIMHYLLLSVMIVSMCLGTVFIYIDGFNSEYMSCDRLYKKRFRKKISISDNDRETLKLIIDSTSTMCYSNIGSPFDVQFGDVFASKNTVALLGLLKEYGYEIDSESDFKDVLEIVYDYREKYINLWIQYPSHKIIDSNENSVVKYVFYIIPALILIFLLISFMCLGSSYH